MINRIEPTDPNVPRWHQLIDIGQPSVESLTLRFFPLFTGVDCPELALTPGPVSRYVALRNNPHVRDGLYSSPVSFDPLDPNIARPRHWRQGNQLMTSPEGDTLTGSLAPSLDGIEFPVLIQTKDDRHGAGYVLASPIIKLSEISEHVGLDPAFPVKYSVESDTEPRPEYQAVFRSPFNGDWAPGYNANSDSPADFTTCDPAHAADDDGEDGEEEAIDYWDRTFLEGLQYLVYEALAILPDQVVVHPLSDGLRLARQGTCPRSGWVSHQGLQEIVNQQGGARTRIIFRFKEDKKSKWVCLRLPNSVFWLPGVWTVSDDGSSTLTYAQGPDVITTTDEGMEVFIPSMTLDIPLEAAIHNQNNPVLTGPEVFHGLEERRPLAVVRPPPQTAPEQQADQGDEWAWLNSAIVEVPAEPVPVVPSPAPRKPVLADFEFMKKLKTPEIQGLTILFDRLPSTQNMIRALIQSWVPDAVLPVDPQHPMWTSQEAFVAEATAHPSQYRLFLHTTSRTNVPTSSELQRLVLPSARRRYEDVPTAIQSVCRGRAAIQLTTEVPVGLPVNFRPSVTEMRDWFAEWIIKYRMTSEAVPEIMPRPDRELYYRTQFTSLADVRSLFSRAIARRLREHMGRVTEELRHQYPEFFGTSAGERPTGVDLEDDAGFDPNNPLHSLLQGRLIIGDDEVLELRHYPCVGGLNPAEDDDNIPDPHGTLEATLIEWDFGAALGLPPSTVVLVDWSAAYWCQFRDDVMFRIEEILEVRAQAQTQRIVEATTPTVNPENLTNA